MHVRILSTMYKRTKQKIENWTDTVFEEIVQTAPKKVSK